MRRWRTVGVSAAGLVGIGAAAVVVGLQAGADDGGSGSPSGAAARPPATDTVTRQDLVETESVTGTLGYGDQSTVTNGRRGTVTWLPEVGATRHRGQALYRVDTTPVTLMYGTVPMYRTLGAGVDDGRDVRQLERNLTALGYTGFTVDEEYSSATAAAVEEWQADVGLPETGRVEVGDVVFTPGEIRVVARKLTVGGAAGPGAPALDVSGSGQQVTVPVPVSQRSAVREGAKVEVELPGGDTVGGKVTAIGRVAKLPGDDSDPGSQATIDVTVTLQKKARAGQGAVDQAPVTVDFTSETRKDVLTVPVTALLALREGGYGVQVVTGSTTKYVAVQTGLFADGRVEVTGAGLAEGQRVGVPKL